MLCDWVTNVRVTVKRVWGEQAPGELLQEPDERLLEPDERSWKPDEQLATSLEL